MRLLFLILALLSLRGHAVECDWSPIEKDQYGCVNFFWYRRAEEMKCTNMPDCFKFQVIDVEDKIQEPPKKKEFFTTEKPEEKKKIIPILDSSAMALLKNSKFKDIKIIFYNKTGKLSKDFQKEAEKYLLEKGVKREQFIVEIR